jgi:hypothetical protein
MGSILESKACKTAHNSIYDLKASITKNWRYLSKVYIFKTCQQFWPRLKKVNKMEGGLFAKKFLIM